MSEATFDRTRHAGCPTCDLLQEEAGETLHETEHFTASFSSRYPHGIVLCAKRHGDGLADLTPAEAADFGELAQRAAAAMRDVWSHEIYLAEVGVETTHFHVVMHAEHPPLAAAFRTALFQQVTEMAGETERSTELARAVGAALGAR
jgi:galactose-1-phosphate uridylyltransferase